jgi:predicted O-linked N-acetylglucosamine transferase (SPINDLY family)
VPSPSRAEAGIPEGKFVFCSFNNSYKYNPDVWDLWCSILREAPDAIIWLSNHGDAVSAHLCDEAEKRGVARERIVFAVHAPSSEAHLARLALADLALDPFPYNAHSTGVDTLWAGVPMVSMLGELFASRVGASIVTAAGLPELVVGSREEYYALALDLYRDRGRLRDFRARLEVRPAELPLFNMQGFTAALEALYLRMLEEASQGRRRPLPAN